MSAETMWQAVEARSRNFDGSFVYAVASTGIYCRPSCPSRRPRRHNVAFYPHPEGARRAGYRPCRRCHPDAAGTIEPRVEKARKICRFIEARLEDGDGGRPTLAEIAAEVGGSPHHLQRSFKQVMGLSPAAYADARRLARLKHGLKAGEAVTGAMYDAGYGAPSRLYERSNGELGMTPATYAKGGKGARIAFAIVDSPLGRLCVAATERGVCFLSLGDDDTPLRAELEDEFPQAEIRRDDAVLRQWTDAVVAYLAGQVPHPDLPLDVRATAWQRRVWAELMRIPAGSLRSYTEIARRLGNPKARRAVARACATNPVSLAIPCHRVVREDGGLGGYRWGLERKAALHALESQAAKADAA